MSVCSNCGAELDAGAKFCMECGTPVPQVKKCVQCGMELPLKAKFCFGCGVPQEGAPAGAGISMGDKNVVAGDVVGQKVAGDNVQNKIMGNMIVNNVHDDTKKVANCHVCGKHLAGNEGYHCPKCNQYVCEDHFDKLQNCCRNCSVQSKNEFIVDINGSGDTRSISEALQYAEDGATIIVKPGTYRDSFVVDKDVTIYGEEGGNGLPVIWNDTEENHFVMRIEANAKISDLIIQGAKNPFTEDYEYPARPEDKTPWEWWPRVIEVESSCMLNNIGICNSAGHGIAVSGANVKFQMVKCHMYGNRRMGVWCIDGSETIATSCEMNENIIHGFCAGDGASAKITRSEIHNNLSAGVYAFDMGKVSVEKSEIFANKSNNLKASGKSCSIEAYECDVRTSENSAAVVDDNGSLIIENCKIYDVPNSSAISAEGGTLRVKQCEIYKVGYFGMYVANNSNAEIEKCGIHDCKKSGLIARDENTHLKAKACSIFDCGQSGVYACLSGFAEIADSRIYHCDQKGVLVTDKGSGMVTNCNIYENNQSVKCAEGWNYERWEVLASDEGSSVTINQSKIGTALGNKAETGGGCRVTDGAKCVIENTNVDADQSSAAVSLFQAFFEIKNCYLRGFGCSDNECLENCRGLDVTASEGSVEGTSLYGKYVALDIMDSQIKVDNCNIQCPQEGDGYGMSVHIQSLTDFDKNSVIRVANTKFYSGRAFDIFVDPGADDNLEEVRFEDCTFSNTTENVDRFFDNSNPFSDYSKLAPKIYLSNISYE